jgi:hypothetical protein
MLVALARGAHMPIIGIRIGLGTSNSTVGLPSGRRMKAADAKEGHPRRQGVSN